MPNPRTPTARAAVTGAAAKNPQRHRGRAAPKAGALGAVSSWLTPTAKKAWASFRRELPWLTEADRALLEVAATIRGRLMAKEDVGVSALNQLRMCLAQMGATPADRSKITVPDEGEADPTDAYFGGTQH